MKVLCTFLFAIFFVALAQANVGKKGAALDSKTSKYEHLVINFNKGSTALPAAEQTKLTTFLNEAKSKGNIDEIEVAVWSDKSFPAKGAPLSKSEQDLADDRGDAVEDFIEEKISGADVEVYNMAEKTNWLARAFNTEEAELKSMFMREGEAPITNDEYLAIKNAGAPQKGVVLVKYETADAMGTTVTPGTTGTTGTGTSTTEPDSY